MQNYYTEDFAKLGARERWILKEILEAWEKYGLPKNFEDDQVKPAFNMGSGYVFLVNSEYQTVMLNGDKLELYHSCPECGCEGFTEDLKDNGNKCCKEYVKQYED